MKNVFISFYHNIFFIAIVCDVGLTVLSDYLKFFNGTYNNKMMLHGGILSVQPKTCIYHIPDVIFINILQAPFSYKGFAQIFSSYSYTL